MRHPLAGVYTPLRRVSPRKVLTRLTRSATFSVRPLAFVFELASVFSRVRKRVEDIPPAENQNSARCRREARRSGEERVRTVESFLRG